MSVTLEEAKEAAERRRRSDRRQKLFHILELILDGKIDSSKTPLAELFNQREPRQSYVSPKNRATHNYGYMEINEMLAGTPFYGEL
jgi:hypothetical protein